MFLKTSHKTTPGTQRTGTEHKVVIDLYKLPYLGLDAKYLTRGTATQFAKALQTSAKSIDTSFNCCDSFIADKVSFQTKGHWFYVIVDKKLLSTYWSGDSADSGKVHMLLGRAFGMFAVMTQDPTTHQVLLEGEPESAIKTSKGLFPERVNKANPMVSHVANIVDFEW